MQNRLPAALRVFARSDGWLGLALVAALAGTAMAAAAHPTLQQLGFGALTLAIVLGVLVGNFGPPRIELWTRGGVEFCKGMLLRAGIVLYGFRITLQQIADIGWRGLAIDLTMIGLCFALALVLGRLLQVDRETAILVGAGSSICGAAAVMATEPILRAPAHKVSVAVATVVLFGTLAMLVYPCLYAPLGLTEVGYGIYVGSTVHEVAQVVVAGRSIGNDAAAAAVIVKMLRVMLLAPFLLLVSLGLRWAGQTTCRGQAAAEQRPMPLTIPWFAILFVLVAGLNSCGLLPARWVAALVSLDTWLLTLAMAALGLRTQLSAIRQAGPRPLVLAAGLFLFLLVGGYGINRALQLGFRQVDTEASRAAGAQGPTARRPDLGTVARSRPHAGILPD